MTFVALADDSSSAAEPITSSTHDNPHSRYEADTVSLHVTEFGSDGDAFDMLSGEEVETEGDTDNALNSLVTVSSDEREFDSDTDIVGDSLVMLSVRKSVNVVDKLLAFGDLESDGVRPMTRFSAGGDADIVAVGLLPVWKNDCEIDSVKVLLLE
jgi:hypothetical protein